MPATREKKTDAREEARGLFAPAERTKRRPEAIADRIEAELQDRPEREMTTEDIGARLMQELKGLDQIAYVRFASVYRQFRDIGQFKREVDELQKSKG